MPRKSSATNKKTSSSSKQSSFVRKRALTSGRKPTVPRKNPSSLTPSFPREPTPEGQHAPSKIRNTGNGHSVISIDKDSGSQYLTKLKSGDPKALLDHGTPATAGQPWPFAQAQTSSLATRGSNGNSTSRSQGGGDGAGPSPAAQTSGGGFSDEFVRNDSEADKYDKCSSPTVEPPHYSAPNETFIKPPASNQDNSPTKPQHIGFSNTMSSSTDNNSSTTNGDATSSTNSSSSSSSSSSGSMSSGPIETNYMGEFMDQEALSYYVPYACVPPKDVVDLDGQTGSSGSSGSSGSGST
ncbi:hypothetical protein B0T17DRAFT_621428 [Bombardia bombarda]|uniref:Uncharacterized protein n=1 Tax=Bombardia bombarda TaxID=252184 RepID=A0AA39U107_9PEZI|nr:hypothetical protein B0T17DRAFT_621428 [Bombardia bombarda]